MKRNVDLTFKRDFNNSDDLNSFFNHIRLFLKQSKIPWKEPPMRVVRSDEDLVSDKDLTYKEILIIGNKQKRKETKKERWLQSNICDCCGKPLNKFPWKYRYGLCEKCDNQYLSQEKIIWRKEYWEKKNRIAWR